MRPDALLITSDARLAWRVKALLDGRLAVAPVWVDRDRLRWELLIVDVSNLSPEDWRSIEYWSHHQPRKALVLIDDGCVPRERLASILADALVPSDATDLELKARIEDVSHGTRMYSM